MTEQKRTCIAISRPGETFSNAWLCAWEGTLMRLAPYYDVRIVNGHATEVCSMRVDHAKTVLEAEPRVDLWLTVDDDNPPDADAVVQLLADLEHNPGVGIVAGWYWQEKDGELYPSFGRSFNIIGSDAKRRMPADLKDFLSPTAPHLQEIDWTGLGLVLMRREALERVGYSGFWPELETVDDVSGWIWDDTGFCKRAKAAGVRIFVDRLCWVPHLKLGANGNPPFATASAVYGQLVKKYGSEEAVRDALKPQTPEEQADFEDYKAQRGRWAVPADETDAAQAAPPEAK